VERDDFFRAASVHLESSIGVVAIFRQFRSKVS
jgi:hypothetical protein